MHFSFFFFFFQAEDGIRDHCVTGVQTCALPILQEKGSFSDPSITFATGATVFKHNDKEIVAAGTKDGRIILLDAGSLAKPLYSSQPVAAGAISADGLATWQEMTIAAPPPPAAPAAPPAGGGGFGQ